MGQIRRANGWWITVLLSGALASGQTVGKTPEIPDFDARWVAAASAQQQTQAKQVVDQRAANVAAFLAAAANSAPGTRVSVNAFGLPKAMSRDGAALTAPSAQPPSDVARNFLRSHTNLFGLAPAEIDRLRLVFQNRTADATFLAFTQTVAGIDVFEGQIKLTLDKSGAVVLAGAADVVPGAQVAPVAKLTAEQAVDAALRSVRASAPEGLARTSDTRGRTAFANPAGSELTPVTAELSVFPLNASTVRLAYKIYVMTDFRHAYHILIDAGTGQLLFRQNVVVSAAQARVWTKSPIVGSRQLQNMPDAWLPANGTVTLGNNTDTFLDANGNGAPDPVTNATMQGGRAFSAARMFDFLFGDGTTGQDPREFPAASITNVFWFVNTFHDYFYALGFTESAANFQISNFGLGGVGNDPVVALAQCGAGTNNAFFTMTTDGTPPYMCMGIWTQGTASLTDDRDSGYDGMIAIHEYGHGVSSRLVGAGVDSSCLFGPQSGAMGEGWSDYFATSFYNDPIMGAYSSNRAAGIRRASYEGYPLTYEDIGNQGYQVHRDGEIWAATLWELRKELGAAVTDQLVVNGLKGTICRPSMIDARDAILAADQVTNGGANRAKIWQVFAKHGMGYTANGVDGNFLTGTRYDANYDRPPDLQVQRSPAILSNPLSVIGSMNAPYNYNIMASNPNGGALNYALNAGPGGMTVNPTTGAVSWIATFTPQRVKVTVTDGMGGKVVHGYLAPVFTGIPLNSPVNIAGANGMSGFAFFETPPNAAPAVQTTLRGGSGDADLYVVEPTGNFYGFSYRWDNFETLTFPSPAGGFWFVQVVQFTPYSATLRADLVTPSLLQPNANTAGLGDVISGERLYRIDVPAGTTMLNVNTSGGSGNVNLFLRRGNVATCQEGEVDTNICFFDHRTNSATTTDSIGVTNPAAGAWYLDLMSFSGYANVTLSNTVANPALLPDLTIAKTHTDNFFAGQVGATYSIVVSNVGTVPASGLVQVVDTLPGGLTPTAMSGTGWSCTLGNLTCTRSAALAPGASYPPITLTVNVALNAPASFTNTAVVSGGGDASPLNNTATDQATLVVPLPESPHPYPNNFDFTWTYTLGAAVKQDSESKAAAVDSLSVTFDPRTSVENGADWIYVMNGANQNIPGSPFTGTSLAGQTVNVPGATVKIRLLTDARRDDWGFKVTSIVAGPGGVPDLTISKSHSGNFAVGQTGAQYTITVQNGGSAATSGTVAVTDTLPTGLSAVSMQGAGWSCTQPVGPCTRSDALNAGSAYPPITLTVNVTAQSPTTVTNNAAVTGGGDATPANNTASDSTTIVAQLAPNLTIAKSHVGDFVRGQTGVYTIVVSNTGTGPSGPAMLTVTDILPAGLLGLSMAGVGWNCQQPGGSCTRSDGLAAGASYPPITFTVQVAQNAPNLVVNVALLSGGPSASDPTNIVDPPVQGCQIESPHPYPDNFDQTWTCTLPGATSLNVTFDPQTRVDPSDLIYVMDGANANIPGSPFTGTALAGQTKTVPGNTVKVRLLADGRRNEWGLKVTSVTPGGGGGGPDLAMAKSHTGNFTRGQAVATYTLTVRNVGTGPTSGQVSVTDNVPAGLTATGIAGQGWNCTQPAGPCTRGDALAAGNAYPDITLTVTVAADAPNSVSNSATVTGGGDTSTGNNTAVDPTTIEAGGGVACVLPESPHPYPDNFDQTWTCTLPGNPGSINVTFDPRTMIESSGDWLYIMDRNGVNIPGSPFTGNALAGQTKSVPFDTLRIRLVSDGRRNEWGFKVTSVVPVGPPAPDLLIEKTHTGNFQQGQAGATYTITVRNIGGAATSGMVTVTDNVPAGLTAVSMQGTGWNCTQPAGPCTRSDALAPGAAYPAITLTVNVAANAPASVTNSVTVAGGGDTNPANNQAFDPATITGTQPPCVLPESPHPYPNDFDFTWTCTWPGNPAGLQVTFDPQTSVEFDNDWIYVTDGSGVNIPGSPFTGTVLAGQTKLVPGGTVRIRLVSNRRIDGYGFKVTNIVAVPAAGLKP